MNPLKLLPKQWISELITGEYNNMRISVDAGAMLSTYTLNSTKVDYPLARRLYENVEDDYKLGAAFAKPVVNTTLGFMGIPRFTSTDLAAQEVLDTFFPANISRMQETQKYGMMLGDIYVWLTREEMNPILYPESKVKLIYNIIPPDQVIDIETQPITGKVIKYVMKSQHKWTENGVEKDCIILQYITEKTIETRLESGRSKPPDMDIGMKENPWGFIPIVHFKNEPDVTKKFGRSDLEPIEPFMRAYHDVFLLWIQGVRLHNNPKLLMFVNDLEQWLYNNFAISNPVNERWAETKLNFSGKEAFFFSAADNERAETLEPKSSGEADNVLKRIFYCIVDASETPEFVFGVHTPSALASVQEQMPILVRKVSRKREQFTEPWQTLARMVLAMTAMSNGRSGFGTHKTTITWDQIDPRSDIRVAEVLERFVNALSKAVTSRIMSIQAAVEFLQEYIPTISQFISDNPELPGERERILADMIMTRDLKVLKGKDDGRDSTKSTDATDSSGGPTVQNQ